MKILVFGGTGAMGVPVVEILAERGHDVCVTTRKERAPQSANVHYIVGDAKDRMFVESLLTAADGLHLYDVLIDFMIYGSEEFRERIDLLCGSVGQYFFFSSSRVYADAGAVRITEESPRLLDAIEDPEYLATDEYALAKAREEDALRNSCHTNWTIIRPYITYNDARLQLGVLEKEQWLQRALEGKAVVFSKDIAERTTTLTYGYDVSLRVADLVGVEAAKGETFHIATEQTITWGRVLKIYLDTLEMQTGTRPRVVWAEHFEDLAGLNRWQIRYDRLYDRRFDSRKIQMVTGETRPYTETEAGLKACLDRFLKGDRRFLGRNWKTEAAFDRISGDRARLADIRGRKNKLRYVVYRYIMMP